MYSWLFLASCLVAPLRAATFSAGQSWQIILDTPIDMSKPLTPDVAVYDVDVYDTPASTIAALKAKGKIVICYFSAGTYEDWRSDASQFVKSEIGLALPEWKGEYWLNVSSPNVRRIMTTRINYAAGKGCDAIDPDNMDGYDNKNGLGLTQAQSIDYLKFMASVAAAKGMKTGLKNSLAIIPGVSSIISFAVNEECAKYGECGAYTSFLASGKPVFNIEYPAKAPKVSAKAVNKYCTNSGVKGMSTVLKQMELNGWVEYCDGSIFTTATTTVSDSGVSGGSGKPAPAPATGAADENDDGEDDDDDEDDDDAEVTSVKAPVKPTTSSSTKKATSTTSSSTKKPTAKTTSTTAKPTAKPSITVVPKPSTTTTSKPKTPTPTLCAVHRGQQCGPQNFKGCTPKCVDPGSTCRWVSGPKQFQCS